MNSGVGMTLDCLGVDALDTKRSLLSRLQQGDTAAVGEAYDLYHGAVRAFATRLLGDPVLAEDVVHDVFVALPRAVSRFRGESSVKTFLISIAVNHVRHYLRSAKRRRAATRRLSSEPPPSHGEDPERYAERVRMARLLSAALDGLSLDHRVAFVLCEVEERTSREAAAILAVPEATVRTRLFHAKRKLRQRLQREGIR